LCAVFSRSYRRMQPHFPFPFRTNHRNTAPQMSAPVFSQPGADVFVPDGAPIDAALARTTHLAIMAHADDLEFSAWSGIDACFGRVDRWFTGIVVTDGAGSPRTGQYANYTAAQMIEARRAEQRAAAVIGEYSAVVQLGHSSAEIKKPANRTPVEELGHLLMRMPPPEVVYLHNPADRHDTHVAVFLRSLEALRALPTAKRPARVYGCEGWRDLDWLVGEDKICLPAGGRPHLQAALAGVFDSQIAGGKRYDLAIQGRRLAHATFQESHATDREAGLTLAMDLRPLVRDDSLDPVAYAVAYAERLVADVRARLERFG
jgi:LmbE family N-acetylglucosaminyl deacetylase